jgi:hypothetical protein
MKKIIYCALALGWSASVLAMGQPEPSAPPAEELGVSPEELKEGLRTPATSTEAERVFVPRVRPEPSAPLQEELPVINTPLYREPAKSVNVPMPQEELPQQPWYQRYWNKAKTTWNTTKAIAQTSWSWLRPAAVGAAKGSWRLIKLGASGVVNAAHRLNRKINYD